MTEAQKLVATIMRNAVCQFNDFDGSLVADWLEANEDKYIAFFFTREYHTMLVLRDIPDNQYLADTLFISTKDLADAELICKVAKGRWAAQEVDIMDKEKCDELAWYEHEILVRVWWD